MSDPHSELTLVLAPTENDSSVAKAVLEESGVKAATAFDVQDLCEQIKKGCAAIVIAEEALPIDHIHKLQKVLNDQEAWSDIPVILLTGEGAARSWESFSASGNISILERPFSRLTLIRAVQVALRARRKQYQVRYLMEQQQAATQKRDDFLAILSHELRTPLNVILGWLEILRSGGLDKTSQLEALMVLERNARVQKALIDDLLDTSRIVTNKLHFENNPISLNQLIKTTVTSFVPRAEEQKLKLNIKLPKTDCIVLGDEQRLAQVITNLITNAIKFTPAHGKIDVELKKLKSEYRVSVKDTGQGIEADFLPLVFDRFKQEDMSTTRSHGGLGLGLAITAHIVEKHNGRIEVKSEGRFKGAEFTLTLPAYLKSVEVTSSAQTDSRPEKLSGVKILVVDDSPDILQLINLWLKKAKAEVKLVGSGPEALKELPVYQPDILLSDIGMPGMDGYELIHQVRELSSEARNVQAIALTAYAKDEERTRALEAGFQMHISKPISNEQLVSAVSSLITLH